MSESARGGESGRGAGCTTNRENCAQDSPPWLMILFCWPSATEGSMKEIMHVSQSEQQPQRPVLHLSDMLADVGSASPRAEEERVFNTPRTVVLCLSLPSHVNKVNEACRAKGLCDTSSDGF